MSAKKKKIASAKTKTTGDSATRTRKSKRKTRAITTAVVIAEPIKTEPGTESWLQMVRLKEPEETAMVSLSGFLQRTEANKISQAVNTLQGQGIKKAIFNLAEVKYANSSAIGALVNSASTLKAAGGQAVLLAMQPNLMKVFETLGLANLFTMVATEKDAIKAIS